MTEFGEALPRLRRRVKHDLALQGLPREKVLAVVAGLLDARRVRIGNAEYARDNRSFDLTTLQDRHVRFMFCRAFAVSHHRNGFCSSHSIIEED